MSFQIPAQLRPVRPRIDGSTSIAFDTGEISGEDMAYLHNHTGQTGTLLFTPEGATEEIKEIKGELAKKSQSQRLKSVIWLYWKDLSDKGKTTEDSETFYKRHTERLIDQYKELLPPQ